MKLDRRAALGLIGSGAALPGIGMAASSLLVVLNAMRLQRATRTERAGAEN